MRRAISQRQDKLVAPLGLWCLPVVDILVSPRVISKRRSAARRRFNCLKRVFPEIPARDHTLLERNDRRQVTDRHAVKIAQTPAKGVRAPGMASVDRRWPFDRTHETAENVVNAIRATDGSTVPHVVVAGEDDRFLSHEGRVRSRAGERGCGTGLAIADNRRDACVRFVKEESRRRLAGNRGRRNVPGGVRRPIASASDSANQSLPSGPVTIP